MKNLKENKNQKKLVIVVIFFIIFLCIYAMSCGNSSKYLDFIKLLNKNYNKGEKGFNSCDIDFDIKKADSKRILKNLEYICRHPRKSGSDESIRVIEWLEQKLIKYGYSIQRQEFGVYRQSLESEILGDYNNLNPYNEKSAQYQSANVIAIKNTDIKTDKTLVISAHYDTTSNTRGVIDNGSGVATVLEIANILESYSLPFQIKFIFFGCEEYHLTGSKYYLRELSDEERENIIGCINIDMIGDAELEDVILGTKDGTENGLTLRLLNAHKENAILKTWQSIGTSDDVSFDRWNIPSILVSDRKVNPKWIRKEAPISAIDTKRLEEIVNVLCSMIISIDINEEFKNYKGQINVDGISPLYKSEDIMNNCVPGYKLVNSEENLLENELGSQLCYLFENNKKQNYKIIQQYENPFIEQFRKSSQDYLLIKEGNSYRLVVANNGDHYITQIIGNMNQIRYLAKIWNINI